MAYVLAELADEIGTVTFNHDAHRNALSRAFIEELLAALERLSGAKVRVVVLRARPGTTVWSAGHDLRELPKTGADPLAYSDPVERVIRAIEHFPTPVLGMIDGSVWGGAFELALVCDLLVGTRNASFAITPAKIGLPYNSTGLLHFINALGMNTVKEMFFTARPINAERALQLGILNRLVEPSDLESVTYELARAIAANSPLSIRVVKEQLRILGNAHPLSPETFERIQGLRQAVFDSHDYREGTSAIVEKRRPVFIGE
ncbi:MAG TPA: methylmalonyl-CoA decarboxylase [Candidatus Margulisiibacteriota bacterium]|nr:methylmalonyl-CoA decarboxylase [Candidatus Margulisiibacteriota bacterium]